MSISANIPAVVCVACQPGSSSSGAAGMVDFVTWFAGIRLEDVLAGWRQSRWFHGGCQQLSRYD